MGVWREHAIYYTIKLVVDLHVVYLGGDSVGVRHNNMDVQVSLQHT